MIGPASSLLTSDVDVLDRLAPAAQAAAQLGADDAGHACDLFEQRQRRAAGLVDADAVADLAEERDPFENLRLRLSPKPFNAGNPPLARRF